ncbi:MAG: CYTH domain-containing protein [Lachnospiraceae bacterium]|nr:CYTH domain-containing protein [Lachnospiraceae bacterium]
MEIEKKFLIKSLPSNLGQYKKKDIEQGYLCLAPVVRIRKSNSQYILTYKSLLPGTGSSISGVRVNNELEAALTKEGYEHLREKTDGYIIKKTRYLIPLPDGHTGELDIFEGNLKGLYFIEVEFADEEDAAGFVPPVWFGENVSNDERYTNSFLSQCASLDVFLN